MLLTAKDLYKIRLAMVHYNAKGKMISVKVKYESGRYQTFPIDYLPDHVVKFLKKNRLWGVKENGNTDSKV